MKKCPVCHTEADDSAKFCSECGSPLETAAVTDQSNPTAEETVTTAPAENNVTDTASASESPVSDGERWYYVQAGKAVGPFSKDAFLDLIADGTIAPTTYVYTKGMSEWTYLKNTDLYSAPAPNFEGPVDEIVEKEVEPQPVQDEKQEWFYVQDGRTYGPFSKSVMIQYINSGLLMATSYVWKEGMKDWQYVRDTELASALPRSYETYQQPNPQPAYGSAPSYLQPRSVFLYLLLSLITCGIFDLVWIYMLAKDIRSLSLQRGMDDQTDPGMVLLFSVITCGIYFIYYVWKAENQISRMNGENNSSSGIVMVILALILQPAALAILQDQVNNLIKQSHA